MRDGVLTPIESQEAFLQFVKEHGTVTFHQCRMFEQRPEIDFGLVNVTAVMLAKRDMNKITIDFENRLVSVR